MSADKQSDKQIYLTELTPVSTKRTRTEEIALSQLQVEDFQLGLKRIHRIFEYSFEIIKRIFFRFQTNIR